MSQWLGRRNNEHKNRATRGYEGGFWRGLEMFEVKGGAYTYVIIGLSFGDTILGVIMENGFFHLNH